MDNFFIEAVTLEITEKLAGARIDKIHQPEPELLLMRLWNGREELRLLLDATGGNARLHLTNGAWNNPFTPPRFCQLLRSRLTRILSIEKSREERIVHLRCRGREGENYLLIAELLGMQANLLLVDNNGRIIDALKRSAAGREIVPGRLYVPPVPKAPFPLAGELPEIPSESTDPAVFKRFLMTNLAPMSPLVASELAAAVAAGVPPGKALADFRRCWLAREFRPVVGILTGKPVLSAFPLPHLGLDES